MITCKSVIVYIIMVFKSSFTVIEHIVDGNMEPMICIDHEFQNSIKIVVFLWYYLISQQIKQTPETTLTFAKMIFWFENDT